jgi:hypothetical protein
MFGVSWERSWLGGERNGLKRPRRRRCCKENRLPVRRLWSEPGHTNPKAIYVDTGDVFGGVLVLFRCKGSKWRGPYQPCRQRCMGKGGLWRQWQMRQLISGNPWWACGRWLDIPGRVQFNVSIQGQQFANYYLALLDHAVWTCSSRTSRCPCWQRCMDDLIAKCFTGRGSRR